MTYERTYRRNGRPYITDRPDPDLANAEWWASLDVFLRAGVLSEALGRPLEPSEWAITSNGWAGLPDQIREVLRRR